jgi:hypothetical protein
MSTYLDKLIESVKQEIKSRAQTGSSHHIPYEKKETQAAGTLRRLEQRLEVLERLRAKETVTAGHHVPRGDGKERILQFEALNRRRTTPVSPRVSATFREKIST